MSIQQQQRELVEWFRVGMAWVEGGTCITFREARRVALNVEFFGFENVYSDCPTIHSLCKRYGIPERLFYSYRSELLKILPGLRALREMRRAPSSEEIFYHDAHKRNPRVENDSSAVFPQANQFFHEN